MVPDYHGRRASGTLPVQDACEVARMLSDLGLSEWLTLCACVGQAALAVLCLSRAAQSALALRLGALCAVMFGWNFGFLAYRVTGAATWHLLDLAVAPLSTAVALDFVLAFIGERRRFRWVCRASYLAFGALGLACGAGFVLPEAQAFAESPLSTALQVALEVPAMAFAFARLALHLRRSGRDERRRGYTVAAALAVAVVGSLSEFAQEAELALPRLGGVASLVAAGLMVLAALRFELLEQRLGLGLGLGSLALGALAVLGYVIVYRALAASTGALVVATSAVTAVVLLGARALSSLHAHSRAERERLVFLGRLAAQMAHDLKNPLAALRAMVQYLEIERAEGRSIDAELPRLALMRGQIDRLTAVIDKYRRLGRVEPVLSEVRLEDVVRDVVETSRYDGDVALDFECEPDLPACRADPDLVAAAAENLVRNALEAAGAEKHREGAAPDRGRVHVRVAQDGARLLLEVKDDGGGMPARVRERVFDDFFTTKAQGSGLGLGFVRRVVDAHRGEIALESGEGGTTFRVWLPAASGAGALPAAQS
ncbi:MAG: two-component sensor histidine kinase [Myxococcales bacterium]|nr:two-component sensor histidine kinase [Myxococcales bacterium]